jgi:hypothetical protein
MLHHKLHTFWKLALKVMVSFMLQLLPMEKEPNKRLDMPQNWLDAMANKKFLTLLITLCNIIFVPG